MLRSVTASLLAGSLRHAARRPLCSAAAGDGGIPPDAEAVLDGLLKNYFKGSKDTAESDRVSETLRAFLSDVRNGTRDASEPVFF